MADGCLICGGTGTDAFFKPCPICSKDTVKMLPRIATVPIQYQGVSFDKSFLPQNMQGNYGTFMEELLMEISTNPGVFQKNMMICARPNCGKTIWAYTLLSVLGSKGIQAPRLMDITEARNIMNSYSKDVLEEATLLSKARCAIIKFPRDIQAWMFDTLSYIVERRVRSNGFTIFLYSGSEEDLKNQDKFDKMKYIKGSGAYNTVFIRTFFS